MKTRENIVVYVALLVITAIILYIEHLTKIEFLYHLAAIPLDALIVVFIIERFLHSREIQQKRRQLMYIKSYLFRADMRNLFTVNLNAVKSPDVAIPLIKNATLEELKKKRLETNTIEYKSPEIMEPVIMEYVNTQSVWQNFMDLAISYDFEDVFHSMVYIIHFIQDVKIFKEKHPDQLFIHHAMRKPQLMQKTNKVLGDGIRVFLDYVIELKQKQPEMLAEVLSAYEISE
jgi:hypothetical protein